MRRIIIKEKKNGKFLITKDQIKHLKVIKRFSQFWCLFEEKYYICVLEEDKLIPIKVNNINNEYKLPITLAISFIKIKYFEWLLQKAVELGVSKIVIFTSQNTEKNNIFKLQDKEKRFSKIIENAVEQSFRNKIPTLEVAKNFKEVLNKYQATNKYIAHLIENDLDKNNKNTIFFPTDSIFLIGPEGGFTKQEVTQAQSFSFEVVSLGRRILRSETAAITMLAKVIEN